MHGTKRAIPFFSSQAVNSSTEVKAAIQRVLDSGWFILGREVASFEAEFATYTGVSHCISVANGSDGLELALRAVGVARGDVVITVANAGFYGSLAIQAVGATPLYVDVDPSTLTMSVNELQMALEAKPSAVIVTHLYGQLADMKALAALCERAHVPLVEDCAQAHGAAWRGRKAGSWGQAACFSFYPTKNLGALGDAGAIVTYNSDVAQRLKVLRQYGWSEKYAVTVPDGRNSRMDELQAAVLRAKLLTLDEHNATRQSIAQRYNAAFTDLPIECPLLGESYVAHLYVIRTHLRDALRTYLHQHEVACDIHYPVADHLQPVNAQNLGSFPELSITEGACQKVLSLPCFPGLDVEAVDRVIAVVRSFFMHTGRAAC